MKTVRATLFKALCYILRRFFMTEYDAMNRARAIHIASDVSIRLYMQLLTDNGFSHCELCPQRFGLRRVGEAYRCVKHLGAARAEVAA